MSENYFNLDNDLGRFYVGDVVTYDSDVFKISEVNLNRRMTPTGSFLTVVTLSRISDRKVFRIPLRIIKRNNMLHAPTTSKHADPNIQFRKRKILRRYNN